MFLPPQLASDVVSRLSLFLFPFHMLMLLFMLLMLLVLVLVVLVVMLMLRYLSMLMYRGTLMMSSKRLGLVGGRGGGLVRVCLQYPVVEVAVVVSVRRRRRRRRRR